MVISTFITEKNIVVGLKAHDKREVLEELVELLGRNGLVSDRRKLVKQLMDRESLGSTGTGQGIAFPHSSSTAARAPVIAVGISKQGVPFGSLDGRLAHVIFLMVSPEHDHVQHLRTMSVISGFLREKELTPKIKAANSPAEVMALLGQASPANYS